MTPRPEPAPRDGWRRAASRVERLVVPLTLLVAAAVLVARCTPGGADDSLPDLPPPPTVAAPNAAHGIRDSSAVVATGESLWLHHCAACHVLRPGGMPAVGPALVSREYLAFADDSRIDSLIVHGVPGTAMAAWGTRRGGALRDAQVRAITTYLRSTAPSAPSVPGWKDGWRRARKERPR